MMHLEAGNRVILETPDGWLTFIVRSIKVSDSSTRDAAGEIVIQSKSAVIELDSTGRPSADKRTL